MNTFVADGKDGRKVLVLMLEPGNVEKLRLDQPIKIHVDDMFPDSIPRQLDLVIAYSETPVADARSLSKQTDVFLDERTPTAKAKRPSCPRCKSTMEQFAVMRDDKSPIATVYCPMCGNVIGVLDKAAFAGYDGA